MNILESWFVNNKLSLNTSKSKYMLFGTRGQLQSLGDVQVKAKDCALEQVQQFKYLGVVLDPLLDFSQHVKYLESKTLSKIGFLGRIRNFVDHVRSLMLYKTLILPLFDYCDIVYHCLNHRDKHILQKLQNCALRNTVRCHKLTPTVQLHENCSIELLSTRRDIHVSNEMYKVNTGMSPHNIQYMFELSRDKHCKVTRNAMNDNYYVPRCRLETGKRNFRYRGAKNWNALPRGLRQSSSLSVFKRNCASYYSDLP